MKGAGVPEGEEGRQGQKAYLKKQLSRNNHGEIYISKLMKFLGPQKVPTPKVLLL